MTPFRGRNDTRSASKTNGSKMAISDGALYGTMGAVIVLILMALLLMATSVKIVNHAEVMIVEWFGSYKRTLMPGIHFVIPIIEQVRRVDWRYLTRASRTSTRIVSTVTEHIDLREHVIDFGRQHVITKDTVQVDIDTLAYFRIIDPRLAVFKIQNIPDAIEFVTQATLRNIIAQMTLDDTFSSREEINAALLSRVQPDVERWGVSITRVEIFNIIPPTDIKMAMEQQIKAERDRRSEVLRADGERESRIINSRGNAAQVVLQAEGERASAILKAKGEAEAKVLTSRAEAQSMQAIRAAVNEVNIRAVDYLTAVQYLNVLQYITRSEKPSTAILVPVDSIESIGRVMQRVAAK